MAQNKSYTAEEEQAIEQLKKRTIGDLSTTLLEDETLFYRFLKARDFNVQKAESMLRKHLSDRKHYEFDDVIKNYFYPYEHLLPYAPTSFLGYDKEGFVIRYYDVGQFDTALFDLITFKDVIQFTIDYLEKDIKRLMEQTKKLGKPISKMVFILNMDKLKLFKFTSKKVIEWSLRFFTFFQDNYPERIKAVYIINASPLSNLLFSIIKKGLADALIQKIKFFGKSGWQEFLLNEIDAEVLPAFLGGKRTDPDGNPLCNTFIIHGKKIPEELLLKKNKRALKYEKDIEKLVITRISSSDLNFKVSEPNTYIEWKFEIESKDIGFGLFYKDIFKNDSQQEVLIPLKRVDAAWSSEEGQYKCDKPGIYTIRFDNTYSWIYSKEVYYRIRLLNPEELN